VVNQAVASARKDRTHVQVLLGAYILGGFSGGENTAVREHLDRCVLCRAEHDELAYVPGWLDLLAGSEEGDDRDLRAGAGDDAGAGGWNSGYSGRVGRDGSQE